MSDEKVQTGYTVVQGESVTNASYVPPKEVVTAFIQGVEAEKAKGADIWRPEKPAEEEE